MKMGTSNIQHPTSNIQSPANVRRGKIGCSMLDVGCWMFSLRRAFFIFLIFGALSASAQTNLNTSFGPVSISLGTNNGTQNVDMGIKVLFFLTLLSLAPSILLLMTCFTRVVIVLSFVRSALQLQGTPASQIIIGLSLFITYFVMAPVWDNISRDAIVPYQAHQITDQQALDRAFIISELRTAFQMGFLIYVPFILIDIVVATVLMSMGMMMMPPMTISLPLKLLLFVLVDGWSLVVQSLVRSFGT
jgi:flagellar biosynthetic protein FliP